MAETLQEDSGTLAGIVTFATNGDTVDGYLARPIDNQPHPGVILVQEWWGIEPHIKDLARRLAREGYVVLAPDLYHGKVATEPNEAQKMLMALDFQRGVDELRRAVTYLQGREDVQPKKIGATGFCMGGHLTWRLAEAAQDSLAAVAPFYAGNYRPTAENIRKVTAPVMVVWGDEDGAIPAEQREHIVNLLKQEGKTYSAHIYHGGHAFMNDQHPTYRADAAREAWGELLGWFKRYLGAPQRG